MRLLMVALIFLFQQLNPTVPTKHSSVDKWNAQTANEENKKVQKSAPSIPKDDSIGNPPENAPTHKQEEGKTYDPQSDTLYRCYLIFTIIGVVGGFIGIAVLITQNLLLRRQVNYLAGIERPWLMVSVVQDFEYIRHGVIRFKEAKFTLKLHSQSRILEKLPPQSEK